MVATVRGRFTELGGELTAAAGGLDSAAGVVHAASIDTAEPKRDDRLRDSSFLDVARYPVIEFASRRIESIGSQRYRVIGDLTIKDVVRPLVLEATLQDSSGDSDPIRVTARGAILRSEFGLSWSEVLEASGALVSDRVDVSLDVTATRS